MTAADAKRTIGAQVEDDLMNARHMAVMVQWIGMARDYIEGVQWAAKRIPNLAEELSVVGVCIDDPEWGECEGKALRHLHQSIEFSVREIEHKVGLSQGGTQ